MNQSTVKMMDGYWMYVLEALGDNIRKEKYSNAPIISNQRVETMEHIYEIIAEETRKNSTEEE